MLIGYARVSTAGADWNTATDADPSVVTNANAIEFPTASGSWGTVTHFALYDAATGRLLNENRSPARRLGQIDAARLGHPAGPAHLPGDGLAASYIATGVDEDDNAGCSNFDIFCKCH